MSTATGPAYKLKPGVDLFSVPEMLDDVRVAQHLAGVQEFYNIATQVYDHLGKDVPFAEFLSEYQLAVLGQLNNENEHPYLQSLLSPALAYYHNSVRNEIYVRLLNFAPEAKELFAQLPVIEKDMEYYNGSDSQLATITEEEWRDRQEAWFELDVRGKRYPQTLKYDLFIPWMFKYQCVSVKWVKEFFDKLEQPSEDQRRSRIFVDRYSKLFHSELPANSSESVMKVFTAMRYSFEDNNVDVLWNHETHLEDIEKLREEVSEWVLSHPVGM